MRSGIAIVAISAEEFRQQADAICKQYEDRLSELGSPSSLDDLGDFVDNAVPIIEEGNNKLAKLEAPDDLSGDWDRAMELQDENLQVARDPPKGNSRQRSDAVPRARLQARRHRHQKHSPGPQHRPRELRAVEPAEL